MNVVKAESKLYLPNKSFLSVECNNHINAFSSFVTFNTTFTQFFYVPSCENEERFQFLYPEISTCSDGTSRSPEVKRESRQLYSFLCTTAKICSFLNRLAASKINTMFLFLTDFMNKFTILLSLPPSRGVDLPINVFVGTKKTIFYINIVKFMLSIIIYYVQTVIYVFADKFGFRNVENHSLIKNYFMVTLAHSFKSQLEKVGFIKGVLTNSFCYTLVDQSMQNFQLINRCKIPRNRIHDLQQILIFNLEQLFSLHQATKHYLSSGSETSFSRERKNMMHITCNICSILYKMIFPVLSLSVVDCIEFIHANSIVISVILSIYHDSIFIRPWTLEVMYKKKTVHCTSSIKLHILEYLFSFFQDVIPHSPSTGSERSFSRECNKNTMSARDIYSILFEMLLSAHVRDVADCIEFINIFSYVTLTDFSDIIPVTVSYEAFVGSTIYLCIDLEHQHNITFCHLFHAKHPLNCLYLFAFKIGVWYDKRHRDFRFSQDIASFISHYHHVINHGRSDFILIAWSKNHCMPNFIKVNIVRYVQRCEYICYDKLMFSLSTVNAKRMPNFNVGNIVRYVQKGKCNIFVKNYEIKVIATGTQSNIVESVCFRVILLHYHENAAITYEILVRYMICFRIYHEHQHYMLVWLWLHVNHSLNCLDLFVSNIDVCYLERYCELRNFQIIASFISHYYRATNPGRSYFLFSIMPNFIMENIVQWLLRCKCICYAKLKCSLFKSKVKCMPNFSVGIIVRYDILRYFVVTSTVLQY